MFPIFKKTHKLGLTEDDLIEPLDEWKSENVCAQLETIWSKIHKTNSSNILIKSLIQLFGLKFLWYTFLTLLNELMLVLVTPPAIEKLVDYFENKGVSSTDAYLNGCIFILSQIIANVVWSKITEELSFSLIQIQAACTSLIYRKMLRLNQSAEVSTSHVISLISNDVAKFHRQLALLPQIPVALVLIVVVTSLLHEKVQTSAFPGVAVFIVFAFIEIWLARLSGKFWKRIPGRSEQRIRRIAEFISGVHIIKMFCWEKYFVRLVSSIRSKEVKQITRYLMVNAFGLVFFMLFSIPLGVVIWSELYQGRSLSSGDIYYMATIFIKTRNPIIHFSVVALSRLFDLYVSTKKIDNFLCLDECTEEKQAEEALTPKIVVEDVSAKWISSHHCVLKDIYFSCSSNQLVAIVGPVGCGKSSLLNLLLHELNLNKGEIFISGKISYCCQNPCFFPGTVRENIVFYQKFDQERYQNVVEACGLETDFKSFPHGDQTLIRDYGKSLSGGQRSRINLARCIYRKADVYLLDDILAAVDSNISNYLFQKCIKEYLQNKICILVTHSLQYLKSVDRIVLMEGGRIVADGHYEQLQTKYGPLLQCLQGLVEEKGQGQGEYKNEWSLYSTKREIGTNESMQKGQIKNSMYIFYFGLVRGWFNVFGIIVLLVTSRIFTFGSDYYLAFWLKSENDIRSNQKAYSSFYTYWCLLSFAAIFLVIQNMYLIRVMTTASKKLHQLCLLRLSKATIDFFRKNTTGIILNRFSEDMKILDQFLPLIFLNLSRVFADVLGVFIITLIVDVRLAIPVILFLAVCLCFKNFYIDAHRDSKRVESTTRSPLYHQVVYSMQSLSTIRAFKVEDKLTKVFDGNLDANTSARCMYELSQKAFGFWIDMFCTASSVLTIAMIFYFKENFSGADIGLLLMQYLKLVTAIQWGLRQLGEAETEAVSLERLHEYTTIEAEPEREETTVVPTNWPLYGKVEFRNVSLKYDPKHHNVLNNVSLLMQAKEKIGIVGRTGAGKSSLISSIFQLHSTQGEILIDDIDISQLPLQKLRSRISLIPQEPFLFLGTLRQNLDPFEECSDSVLWVALEHVELKSLVESFPNGLHHQVNEGGANFSFGQKQLVCLARALIRKNKILIMDEATANVDSHTDNVIRNSMRQTFAGCTILTVAHRLDAVLDSDKVVVMDEGRVVEFGKPEELLRNEGGIFYKLVRSGGKLKEVDK